MHDWNDKARERAPEDEDADTQEPIKVLSRDEFLRAKARALKNFDSFRARFSSPKQRD